MVNDPSHEGLKIRATAKGPKFVLLADQFRRLAECNGLGERFDSSIALAAERVDVRQLWALGPVFGSNSPSCGTSVIARPQSFAFAE